MIWIFHKKIDNLYLKIFFKPDEDSMATTYTGSHIRRHYEMTFSHLAFIHVFMCFALCSICWIDYYLLFSYISHATYIQHDLLY